MDPTSAHLGLTVLTTIALGLIGWFAKGLEKRLDQKQTDINNLRADVHAHAILIAVQAAAAEPNNRAIQEIKEDLNELMTDVSRMTVLLATLEGRMSLFINKKEDHD